MKKHLISIMERKSLSYYCSGDFLHSLIGSQLITLIDPDNSEALSIRAEIFYMAGEYRSAIGLAETIFARQTNKDFKYRLVLFIASCYFQLKEHCKWEDFLARAGDIAPEMNQHALLRAYWLRDLNRLAEAEVQVLKTLKIDQHIDAALMLLAQIHIARNEEAKAMEILERAIRLNPNATRAYLQLAELAYYREADHPHIEFAKAEVLNPGLRPKWKKTLHRFLGIVYDKLKFFDLSFEHMIEANEIERENAPPLRDVFNLSTKSLDWSCPHSIAIHRLFGLSSRGIATS